jgi:UDP-N-acetylmuramoyl-tripeptide--D-alanyl-D-alanine ligase
MEPRSLAYLSEACGGELRGPAEAMVERVCTDSRQLRPGDLFVALSGPNFDGHDFVGQAAQAGCRAVLVARARAAAAPAGMPAVVVDNPRLALGRLAARYRGDFQPAVIAVGGSQGKTTTKELLAAVLRQKLATLWSEASFNNDIGVPMTLLRLAGGHQAAVIEVGTNHPGELAPLVRLCAPRYGIITALGREHLEFFGDLEGVAGEEGWLAELLPAEGRLFINGDEAQAEKVARRCRAPVTRIGEGPQNDWRVEQARLDAEGVTFAVRAPAPEFGGEYRVNLLGRHQAINATLALAAGAELGLSRAELARGLAECQPPKMRMQVREIRGVRVLDDAYNANADSMLAALETLAALPCAGRRLAVVGDMAELGRHTETAHGEAGRRAAELKLDAVLAVGASAPVTVAAAQAAGLAEARAFADVAAAGAALRCVARAGDVVLLKGSRSARLERISEILR